MPGGLAARVAGWQRRAANQPGPLMAGEIPVSRTVELYISGAWVDITSYVYQRDMIQITRGRANEANQTDPGICHFTVNNRDGRFSPRNPVGAWYGLIGRNTPVRVSVIYNGIRRYRFTGEVSSWTPRSDISGTDAYVQIEASGILRRLGQGATPLKSAMYREMTNPSRSAIVAYWPLEDASTATSFASGLDGGFTMQITSTGVTPAAYTSWNASDALPTMGAGTLKGVVPTYPDSNMTALRFFCMLPSGGVSTTTRLITITGRGTAPTWTLWVNSSGQLDLRAYDNTGAQLMASGFATYYGNGVQLSIGIELTSHGGLSGVDWKVFVDNIDASTLYVNTSQQLTGNLALYAVYSMQAVLVGEDGGLGTTAVGHIALANDTGAYTNTNSALIAWDGENPTTRFLRLCGEEGLNGVEVFNGQTGNTTTLGPQSISTLLDLLKECTDADLSILFEPRDQLAVGTRTRLSLYNQNPALALDVAQHQLSAALEPVDDDSLVRNDRTVARKGGSSAHAILPTGTLSVQEPPDGIGRYDDSTTINVETDDQLPDQAGFRLLLGTVDESRYPTVSLNLQHPTWDDPTMMAAAMTLDIGDRLTIDNPPSQLPPDQISQLVQGFSETIGAFEHTLTINCSPESPYRVAVTDDPVLGRVDTDGSQLAADAAATDTVLSIATTAGYAVWTTDPQDTPFDVRMGGEVVTFAAVGTILNTNPFFLTDASGWTANNSTISRSTTVVQSAYDAAASLLVTPNGSSASGGANANLSAVGTVTPGATYTAVAWVYSPGGWSDLRACTDWYDSSGTFLSSGLGSGTSVPAGTWTFLSQTLTAPASASSAAARIRHGSTPAVTDIYYAWGVRLIPTASVLSTSPQTVTAIRSVNGVVKAQAAGTDLRLNQPAITPL